jgi:hypothetical protein
MSGSFNSKKNEPLAKLAKWLILKPSVTQRSDFSERSVSGLVRFSSSFSFAVVGNSSHRRNTFFSPGLQFPKLFQSSQWVGHPLSHPLFYPFAMMSRKTPSAPEARTENTGLFPLQNLKKCPLNTDIPQQKHR